MPQRSLVFAAVVAFLSSCASQSETPQKSDSPTAPAAKGPEEKKPPTPAKLAQLRSAVDIAKARLDRARKDLDDHGLEARVASEKAGSELELAKMKLKVFDERDRPARIASSKLTLAYAKDRLDDAVEELEQLKLMYKGDELANMTKEIVIRRAERGLSRAREGLENQTRDAATLNDVTLPMERDRLALDVTAKQTEVEKLARANEKSATDKRIAIMSAEGDVARTEAELAEPQGSGK